MEVRYGRQYSSYGALAREIRVADKIMAAPVVVQGMLTIWKTVHIGTFYIVFLIHGFLLTYKYSTNRCSDRYYISYKFFCYHHLKKKHFLTADTDFLQFCHIDIMLVRYLIRLSKVEITM